MIRFENPISPFFLASGAFHNYLPPNFFSQSHTQKEPLLAHSPLPSLIYLSIHPTLLFLLAAPPHSMNSPNPPLFPLLIAFRKKRRKIKKGIDRGFVHSSRERGARFVSAWEMDGWVISHQEERRGDERGWGMQTDNYIGSAYPGD